MQDEVSIEDSEDVLLPSDTIGKKLKGLRRAALSIPNRLRSIAEDAQFVSDVAEAYDLPLIANERCGSWYVPPERRAASAYFKSTDGHFNQWAVSYRRLNLQVLDVVAKHGGCVIVDSTRRGKSMPDALSKTVPIWCAVFNRLLFPQDSTCHSLYTPPSCVSASEHEQIEQRLDSLVQQLTVLNLDLTRLRASLNRPLRALWVTRESTLPIEAPSYSEFYPVVLCTASRRVLEGDVAADGYVQGAGDDNEGWSRGLSADLFWAHGQTLFETAESRIEEAVDGIVRDRVTAKPPPPHKLIEPTTWLYCGVMPESLNDLEGYDLVLHCSPLPHELAVQHLKSRYIHFKCREGKLGSRDLRQQLPKLHGLFKSPPSTSEARRVLTCGGAGSDHALGVALALLCLHDAAEGETRIDKDFIRRRLSWISVSLPETRPLRTTLQSVNEFLMSSDR